MIQRLEEIKLSALQELDRLTQTAELEAWRVRYLGKKSELTQVLRGLAALSLEEKKSVGAFANELRNSLETIWEEKRQALEDKKLAALAAKEEIDITLPGRNLPAGHGHPLAQTIEEVSRIFVSMGFEFVSGPDAEWDYYNFEALNIPAEHPARDNMSTSWVDWTNEKGQRPILLRTHSTSVSARIVETRKPPIRTITAGRVFRYEASDATHTPMFHQLDGLAVDTGITMADLKGTLYEFCRRYFGTDRKVRFRCDYFPFVEPGVEIAIECAVCHGSGCRLCSNSGWIEILGAGMTHPHVLERGGIDPKKYTSFAFGMGINRLPMLRYGIDDIRLFYNNDLRFLRQF